MLFNHFTQLQHIAKLSLAEQIKQYQLFAEGMRIQQMLANHTYYTPAGGGNPFTPIGLFAGGEKGVWFDGSDTTSMFQDVAGTIPVTAVGQSVAKWLDKSGNGFHATQSAAASRPTYQVDPDGKGHLLFDATNDQLATLPINFSGTAQMYVGMGINVVVSASAAVAMELGADVNSVNGSFLIGAPGATTDHSIYLRGSDTIRAAINNISDGDDLITGILDISQATKEAELIPRLNKTLITSPNITWSLSANAGTGSFGTLPLFIGARSGLANPFGGKIYQIVVRGAGTTNEQLYNTEWFIGNRIGE